jgi:hypothetical protein
VGDLLNLYVGLGLTWQAVVLALLVSFLASAAIAKVYEITYQGLSWSPALVQAMVMGSQISAMLMMAIGDSIAGAIGLFGTLALIRFRTTLRDPRDLVFVLASFGVGVAAGMKAYMVAVAGSASFCVLALALWASGFGTRRHHDGLVRFQIPTGHPALNIVGNVLRQRTQHFALVTMREVSQGTQVDYSYQVKLKGSNINRAEEELLEALRSVDGVQSLVYMSQQSTVEV